MNKEQKIKEVQSLKQKFQAAKGVLFAQNKGLKVSEVDALRKELRKEKGSLKVVKNRLLKKALQEAKIEGLENLIEGPLAIAFSETEPVLLAKALVNFVKEHEALVLKGGYVDGKALTSENVKALAVLPSKEELYAMVLRCLMAPATQLANVLVAVPRQLVNAIEAIRKTKDAPVGQGG